MLAKLEIKGIIKVETGMHIGGTDQFSAIGAIDSPVIRDAYTKKPIIPGSSLKGKMRTLLVKSFVDGPILPEAENDPEEVSRLYGSSKKGKIRNSRLIFNDMLISNAEELIKQGVTSVTEAKFENTISRTTAVSNPRQIERVIAGSQFNFSIVYNCDVKDEIVEDISNLVLSMKLLEYDYLGGHGSRGYGKVSFSNIELNEVVGEIDDAIITKCRCLVEEM